MSLTFWLELIASGLITGGIYALVAMGLNLQYGLMRIMNISHGEFLMLGGYLTFVGFTVLGIAPLVFMPIVFAAMFVLGVIVHLLCFRPLVRDGGPVEVFEARSLMIGFGLMFMVQNAAFLIWGGELRGYDYLSQPVEFAGMRFTANKLIVFAVAVALSLGLIALLRFTLLGKGVRALMQSPTGAQLVGIDTKRLHPTMFGIGLGLSGVAGGLLSMTYTLSPSMGEPYTITALIVITLGGFGSMAGSLAGGLLLGVVEALGMHFTSPSLKMLLSYSVFIAVLIWRPNGLFTKK